MNEDHKPSSIYVQMFIFAVILFISYIGQVLLQNVFPVPAPVIGLVLLYIALMTKIVKLHQVEQFGLFMISIIGFLFVPSGISLAKDLDSFSKNGIQLVIVIILGTLFMLLAIGYTAKLLIMLRKKLTANKGGNN